MKPAEVIELHREHPELTELIIKIEEVAAPNLRTIEGLWRKGTKPRPGWMTELLRGL